MKKIFLLLGVFFVYNANAQRFTAGLQLNYVQYKLMGTDNTSITDNLPFWEKINTKAGCLNVIGTFGYNPLFYKFNDDLSIGASVNLGIGYMLAPKLEGLSGKILFDFPEYLTLRYGRNATKKTKKKLGYTVGVGYDYNHNLLPFQGINVMAEICIPKYSFRINTNLFKYTYYYYYSSEGSKPAINIWPIGLSILRKY